MSPKASSMVICRAVFISSSWSCCPWISTKKCPTALSVVKLTICPLMRLTLLPFWKISRRIINSSSTGIPLSSKILTKAGFCSIEKKPWISALDAEWRTTSLEARAPNIRFMASIIMDLPAPVSPVRTVIPFSKFREISSIIAKFFIVISRSIGPPILQPT